MLNPLSSRVGALQKSIIIITTLMALCITTITLIKTKTTTNKLYVNFCMCLCCLFFTQSMMKRFYRKGNQPITAIPLFGMTSFHRFMASVSGAPTIVVWIPRSRYAGVACVHGNHFVTLPSGVGLLNKKQVCIDVLSRLWYHKHGRACVCVCCKIVFGEAVSVCD